MRLAGAGLGWFTGGIDIEDLKQAKALLDELA
jgi:hypothetical protein